MMGARVPSRVLIKKQEGQWVMVWERHTTPSSRGTAARRRVEQHGPKKEDEVFNGGLFEAVRDSRMVRSVGCGPAKHTG